MLEESVGWFLKLARDHVVQDGAHREKPLSSLTEVGKPVFIQENLLDDERGHCL